MPGKLFNWIQGRGLEACSRS